MGFNVTKDTRGTALMPIPVPSKLLETQRDQLFPMGYKYSTARLVNVVFDPEKEVKQNNETTTQPILSFIFADDKQRRATLTFFVPSDMDEAKNDKETARQQERIKHIWDETVGEERFPEEGLAPTAESHRDFFKEVADNFNRITREVPGGSAEKPKLVKMYGIDRVYIKLTYYNNNINFPLYGNIIQRAETGQKPLVCEKLDINPTYDKLSKEAGAPKNSGGMLPTGNDSAFTSFPDDLPNI